jgi:hypothetical protein
MIPKEHLTSEVRSDCFVKFGNYVDERDDNVNYRDPEIFRQCFEQVMKVFPDYESSEKST